MPKELLLVWQGSEIKFAILTNDPDEIQRKLEKAESKLKKALGVDYDSADLAELMEEQGEQTFAIFDDGYEMR